MCLQGYSWLKMLSPKPYFMEPGNFQNAPVSRILQCVQSVGLFFFGMRGQNRGNIIDHCNPEWFHIVQLSSAIYHVYSCHSKLPSCSKCWYQLRTVSFVNYGCTSDETWWTVSTQIQPAASSTDHLCGANDAILHEPTNSYCWCAAVMNCHNNNAWSVFTLFTVNRLHVIFHKSEKLLSFFTGCIYFRHPVLYCTYCQGTYISSYGQLQASDLHDSRKYKCSQPICTKQPRVCESSHVPVQVTSLN